jgi:hypothetical protein
VRLEQHGIGVVRLELLHDVDGHAARGPAAHAVDDNQANSPIASTLNYNWNDPIYEACSGSRSCLNDHWTVGSGARIDFLFFNAAATSAHGQTVSYNDADAADVQFTGSDRGDLNYSDHRAMSARIHY